MTQYIFSNCSCFSERLGVQAWAVAAGLWSVRSLLPHVNQAFALKMLFIVEHGPCSTAAQTLMPYNVIAALSGFSSVTKAKCDLI